jgi:DNA-binding XRE family transcriptional regulator
MKNQEEFEKDLIRKNPEYRKFKKEEPWNADWQSQNILQELRTSAGLTQVKLAKKMKVPQPSIARAENNGCSLTFLLKAAKACKKIVKLEIV